MANTNNNTEFRSRVTADGSSGFPAQAGRYHLYISLGCPFAIRAYSILVLKGLEKAIGVSNADINIDPAAGWYFDDNSNGFHYLKEAYKKSNPNYEGKITVPILWDKEKQTIVNNESLDIMEMFNSEFNQFTLTKEQSQLDFYPVNQRKIIDEAWELVSKLTRTTYGAGFATTQEAYDKNIQLHLQTINELNQRLAEQRYLIGNELITLPDISLFASLVRYNWVFNAMLKCDKHRLEDYPHLWDFCRDLYQSQQLGKLIHRDQIRIVAAKFYRNINPSGVVSIGCDIDFNQKHQRDQLGKKA